MNRAESAPSHGPWLHTQVAEYKYECERLQGEMNEVKRRYFEQKAEARRAGEQAGSRPPSSSSPAPPSTKPVGWAGGC